VPALAEAPADGYGARTGDKFKRCRLKLIQGTLIFEKDDLAVGFTTRLKPDAQLGHRVADEPAVHIHATLAERAADWTLPYCRKDRIRMARVKKSSAFAGLLKSSMVSAYLPAWATPTTRSADARLTIRVGVFIDFKSFAMCQEQDRTSSPVCG
jgi:hypothetical protein